MKLQKNGQKANFNGLIYLFNALNFFPSAVLILITKMGKENTCLLDL